MPKRRTLLLLAGALLPQALAGVDRPAFGQAADGRASAFVKNLRPALADWYTYTPAYNSVVSGVKLTMTHRLSAHTSWAASITSEHDVSSITDEAFKDPTLRVYFLALGLNPEPDLAKAIEAKLDSKPSHPRPAKRTSDAAPAPHGGS